MTANAYTVAVRASAATPGVVRLMRRTTARVAFIYVSEPVGTRDRAQPSVCWSRRCDVHSATAAAPDCVGYVHVYAPRTDRIRVFFELMI